MEENSNWVINITCRVRDYSYTIPSDFPLMVIVGDPLVITNIGFIPTYAEIRYSLSLDDDAKRLAVLRTVSPFDADSVALARGLITIVAQKKGNGKLVVKNLRTGEVIGEITLIVYNPYYK